MYILNQRETAFVDSGTFGMFAITKDSPGYLVGAYKAKDTDAVRLGWYIEKDEAQEALYELFDALNRWDDSFCMPQRVRESADNSQVY